MARFRFSRRGIWSDSFTRDFCLIAACMGNHSAVGWMSRNSALKILQTLAHANSHPHALILVSYPALTQLSDLVETWPERKWIPVIQTVFNLIVLYFLKAMAALRLLLPWGHDWDIMRLQKDGYVGHDARKTFSQRRRSEPLSLWNEFQEQA